jgi:Ca2+-transporting ATPase
VFEILKISDEGLSKNEAAKRLRKYGKNELRAKIKLPIWLILLSRFKELLILILIIGGILSFFIGNPRDGTIIFIIVIVNAVIGFIHEYKAGK